jgi:hypothetical protein
MKDNLAKEGMRIRMVSMIDDPNPIPKDVEGTIDLIDDSGTIHVSWDNGRRLGVIPGVDKYILEPSEMSGEEIFDDIKESNSGSQAIKSSIKNTPSVIKKSMGSMPSVKNTGTNKNFKSSGIKDVKVESEKEVKVRKNPKDKKIKTEMTGAGGAATGAVTSSGPYSGPMGATKPTFGKGPLTKKNGVTKPGPLKKENVFTKKDLIEEITNVNDMDSFDDSKGDAWADKNHDGWKWNDKPAYHHEGEIVDPLAKMKVVWDDDELDISKEWDKKQKLTKNQKLTKEDLLRLVKNRLDEAKKGVTIDLEKGDEILTGKFKNRKETVKKIGKNKEKQPTVNDKPMLKFKVPKLNSKTDKKEKTIEEETTFNSVFGSGFPVVPAFAAKKGEWRTSKKPIWKGGKIVQDVENSGVLNPIKESNDVKWVKGGEYVKVKKKCTKYPYCSQGAIDNPLKVSKKSDEVGSYVEDFMKNVHEVSIETGKSFNEVYQIIKKSINNI